MRESKLNGFLPGEFRLKYAKKISEVEKKIWKKPKPGDPKPIATLLDGQDLITTSDQGAIAGSERLTVLVQNYRPGGFHEPHSHEDNEQVFFVYQGTGQFMLDDEWFDVKEGDVIFVPKGTSHSSRNNSDDLFVLIFINIPLAD